MSETTVQIEVIGSPDRHPERGATIYMFALLLVGMLGLAAVVIDLGQLFTARAKLQATADASALAASSQLPSAANALTMAQTYAGLNYPDAGTVVATGDVQVGYWNTALTTFTSPAPVGQENNAVQVTARRAAVNGNSVPLMLAGIFGESFWDVGATAIAGKTASNIGKGCLWALAPTGAATLDVYSGAILNGADCNMYVNSNSAGALRVTSGASITAKKVSVTGTATVTGATVTPTPLTGQAAYPDPLASVLTPPSNVSAVCGTNPYAPPGGNTTKLDLGGGTYTIYPGVYCGGIGIKSGGSLTLQPGVYVIRGGGFGGGGSIVVQNNGTQFLGSGVMFYLTCPTGPCTSAGTFSAHINIQSGATVNLTAPTSGQYKGMLFYQDKFLKTTTTQNVFQSGSTSYYDGVFYFPTQELHFQSGSGTTTGIKAVLIAYAIDAESGTVITFNSIPTNSPDALLEMTNPRLVK
jgi:Flp pilus assembly protein TadG